MQQAQGQSPELPRLTETISISTARWLRDSPPPDSPPRDSPHETALHETALHHTALHRGGMALHSPEPNFAVPLYHTLQTSVATLSASALAFSAISGS